MKLLNFLGHVFMIYLTLISCIQGCTNCNDCCITEFNTETNQDEMKCVICPTCCAGNSFNDGTQFCSEDVMECKLRPRSDIYILQTTLYIILAFGLGLPLILFITDLLIMRPFLCCQMSLCEWFANKVCRYCCFKSQKKESKISQDGL